MKSGIKCREKQPPESVAQPLSYEDAMNVAREIFRSDYGNDAVINYAIDLFLAVRKRYLNEWDQDFKNSLYVSFLCELTLRYQEAFDLTKEVYERSLPTPPYLASFSFANTYFLPKPDVDTISEDEALRLFKASFEKEATYEAATLIAEIYQARGDVGQADYWQLKAEDAEKQGLHVPVITPDVFHKSTGA